MRDDDRRVSRHFVILCFATRWISGEPQLNEELAEARWLSLEELAGLKTTEGLAEIVAAAFERIGRRRALTSLATLPTPRQRICPASMLKRSLTIALIALTMAAAPVRAIEGGPAPFDGDLMRLAEILGALQYLRPLCGANEGNKWRDQMTALLDAEAQSGDRRNRLVGEFQQRLSQLPADLSLLHAGRERRGAALSRRGREDLARDHRALHQLKPA